MNIDRAYKIVRNLTITIGVILVMTVMQLVAMTVMVGKMSDLNKRCTYLEHQQSVMQYDLHVNDSIIDEYEKYN